MFDKIISDDQMSQVFGLLVLSIIGLVFFLAR